MSDGTRGPAPDGGPAHGGTADAGVVSSVPAGDPAAGDVADLLTAEFGKLNALYGDVVALLEAGELGEAGRRWSGVVRETLEFEAACQRVVVDELPEAARDLPVGTEPARLVEHLQAYDELDPDVRPDEVRTTATLTAEVLEAQQRVLVPAVRALPGGLRDRLGEDLRQVMG